MKLLLVARWVPESDELDTIGIPEAAEVLGHVCTVVGSYCLGEEISLDDVREYDAVICRFSGEPITDGLVSKFAKAGIPVVGAGNGLWSGDDQIRTLSALADAGIPIPQTILIENQEQADLAFERLGCPIVTKDPKTMAGVGVRLAASKEDVWKHFQQLRKNTPLIAQRFYAECAGEDRRLFVVGEEIAESVRRVAQPGEFRANLWLGGKPWAYRCSSYEESIAVAASKAIGIDVAGVDILHTNGGPVVTEVNHNPGVAGIGHVAKCIVRYAERMAHRTMRASSCDQR